MNKCPKCGDIKDGEFAICSNCKKEAILNEVGILMQNAEFSDALYLLEKNDLSGKNTPDELEKIKNICYTGDLAKKYQRATENFKNGLYITAKRQFTILINLIINNPENFGIKTKEFATYICNFVNQNTIQGKRSDLKLIDLENIIKQRKAEAEDVFKDKHTLRIVNILTDSFYTQLYCDAGLSTGYK